MDKLDLMTKITNYIYDRIDYMYCDNCRYNFEINCSESLYDPCESCHRKYNGWALSMACASSLANQIVTMMEEVENEQRNH